MKLKKSSDIDLNIENNTKEFLSIQLNLLLADHFILFTKLNNYHWNLKSSNFSSLHKLFEKGYKKLFKNIDIIAERILQLGFHSLGTLEEFSKYSRLNEKVQDFPSDKKMIENLVNNFSFLNIQIKELINQTEKNYKDSVTNNILIELSTEYENFIWILNSHH